VGKGVDDGFGKGGMRMLVGFRQLLRLVEDVLSRVYGRVGMDLIWYGVGNEAGVGSKGWGNGRGDVVAVEVGEMGEIRYCAGTSKLSLSSYHIIRAKINRQSHLCIEGSTRYEDLYT